VRCVFTCIGDDDVCDNHAWWWWVAVVGEKKLYGTMVLEPR